MSSSSHYIQYIFKVNSNDNNDENLLTVKRPHDQHHCEIIFEIYSIYSVYKVERIGYLFGHEFWLTTGNKTVVNVTKDVNDSK